MTVVVLRYRRGIRSKEDDEAVATNSAADTGEVMPSPLDAGDVIVTSTINEKRQK